MEAFHWLTEHWFDLIQTVGVIGGLLFTAHTIRRDERARTVSNTIAINEQYSRIWHEFYARPALSRILKTNVDLKKQPVSDEEMLFVKTLILHLDTVRRTMAAGIFAKLQGLQNDVRDFFTLPIPKAVWDKIKPFQDEEFAKFVEAALKSKNG